MSPEDEVIEFYLELRRQGMGERQAARVVNSTHRDIQQYADMNPDFAARLEDALLERLERVEAKMWQAAQEGSETAGKLVLESHAPTEWTKPTPDMILRVQQDADTIDIEALRQRLEAAQHQQELREKSIEAKAIESGDEDD